MDWQKYVAGGVLAHDEHGDLLHSQALVSVARQNGKSKLLESACWVLVYRDAKIARRTTNDHYYGTQT
jgi:phage terminase large subunit-like protein